MVLMSWTCESATRRLAGRATDLYETAPGLTAGRRAVAPSRRAAILRVALMVLGVAAPLGLTVAALYTANQGQRVLWLSGIAALAGLALVAGLAWAARR
jgi:hypothetical protein